MSQSFDAFAVKTSFEVLEKEALLLFAEKTKEKGRFLPSTQLENDFIKLGLIQDNKLTRAAELLFGLHHTSIHIGRFKSPSTIIDDTLIKLPLVLAVEEAMNFIKKNIRLGYEFTGELSRSDRWQFPLQAIRELLLNAIIHKDYRNPTDVIIKIFDNEILFSNPGTLFGNLTIEELNSDSYQPRHRNRLLAEAFYLMGEVEKYGTGFIRIRDWLKDYPHLACEIENLGDFTRVVLKQKNNSSIGIEKNVPGNVPGKRLNNIIEIIVQNDKTTIKEFAKALKVDEKTIKRDLDKLKKRGQIERKGPDKGGHWQIIIQP